MDKFLRPEKLNVEPCAPESSKKWKHWYRTFQNFIASLEQHEPDKLSTLINYVSPTVYEFISEVTTYDEAIETLTNLYVKPKNEVFARNILSTCKQEPGQSLDQFLQKLKSYSADCNFKAVSAEQYRDDAIRDAFISGLRSPLIRQRLLENKTLDLETAFSNARSLEMAEKQNQSYQTEEPTVTTAAAIRTADALSRSSCGTASNASAKNLLAIHTSLCHPGVTRMTHFIRSKNLPYSVDEIKTLTAKCEVCAELKPRFYRPPSETLIKATQPFERLSVDFKGPLPSSGHNKYLLTMIDEYSRFPFAFACPDMTSSTVIKCFVQLFSLFGMPSFIHSDRGASFMSEELKTFLNSKGIATSRTTPYRPQANGQVERLNGTLWKAITLALKTENLPTSQWECLLPNALHSIRSLLCTETNCTPHERLFQYTRKSTTGNSLPTWLLSPGPVYLKRNVRSSKYDPLVDEVELLEANPQYAHVRLQDGRETTVSVRQLAPVGESGESSLSNTEIPINDETKKNLESAISEDNLETGVQVKPGTSANDDCVDERSNKDSTESVKTHSYNLRSCAK